MARRPPTSPVLIAALATLGLGACHPKSLAQGEHDFVGAHMHGGVHVQTSEPITGPVTVVSRLDCPETQGALHRTSQSADGRACGYASDKGVVDLALLPGGAADPASALSPLKAKLDAILPREANGGTVAVTSTTDADGREHAKVDLPFIHVRDDGKRSHVRIFGMSVDSDDDDNKSGATTEAKPKTGVEAVYVLAGDTPSAEGYHAVGYVARGGLTGALVVGTFKYRSGDEMSTSTDGHGRHENDSDLDALLDLNAKKG